MNSLKKWEVSTTTGNHFDFLDGLRGVAILLVVYYHTHYTNPQHGLPARLAGYIILAGWMGVPIFFCLSGFLISYPFFQKREANPLFWYPTGYAWRRVGKILPPFYLSVLLFIVFYWCLYHDTAYLDSAWKAASGYSYFCTLQISPDFNGVYWSLYLESFFYLTLPFLFWLLRGRSLETTAMTLFWGMFIGAFLIRHYTWPSGLDVIPGHKTYMHQVLWQQFNRFPCQMDYFAWGIIFAGIYVKLNQIREKIPALSLFGYLGMALMFVTLISWGYWVAHFDVRENPTRWSIDLAQWLPGLATTLMLFFIFDPQSLGARILSCVPLRFTGIVSYEWFLFHGPVVKWFHDHSGQAHGNILAYAWRCLLPLVLTFVFAALVYRYFSLPILRFIRNLTKKHTQSRTL